jgi:hypothetical protein
MNQVVVIHSSWCAHVPAACSWIIYNAFSLSGTRPILLVTGLTGPVAVTIPDPNPTGCWGFGNRWWEVFAFVLRGYLAQCRKRNSHQRNPRNSFLSNHFSFWAFATQPSSFESTRLWRSSPIPTSCVYVSRDEAPQFNFCITRILYKGFARVARILIPHVEIPRGNLLTVNFHQPSHEFTFSVGIDLISKLTILTLIIYQVRNRMWFLEFIVYTRIKHLNEDFRVKFIKHFGRRSWSPTRVKTHDEHDSKWIKDRSVNIENIRDLNRRWGSLDCKLYQLNHEGNDVKGPTCRCTKVRNGIRSTRTKDGGELGRSGPRPTGLAHFGPVLPPPFGDLNLKP